MEDDCLIQGYFISIEDLHISERQLSDFERDCLFSDQRDHDWLIGSESSVRTGIEGQQSFIPKLKERFGVFCGRDINGRISCVEGVFVIEIESEIALPEMELRFLEGNPVGVDPKERLVESLKAFVDE